MTWYVYVARCSDDSLYCGIARDVEARIAEHDAGKGARYTRGRGPLHVLLVRRCRTHGNALRAEYKFKQLTRPQKERAIVDPRMAGVYWRRYGSSEHPRRRSPGLDGRWEREASVHSHRR